MVEIQNVRKRFGDLEVLKGISLEIAEGEVVCIIGPSGSGKTTLLRCINFLETYQEGRILIDGELIGFRERNGELAPASEKAIAKMRAETGMVIDDEDGVHGSILAQRDPPSNRVSPDSASARRLRRPARP